MARSAEPAPAAGRHAAAVPAGLCGFDTLFVVVVVAALVAVIIAIAGHGLGPGFSDTLALVVITRSGWHSPRRRLVPGAAWLEPSR